MSSGYNDVEASIIIMFKWVYHLDGAYHCFFSNVVADLDLEYSTV